MYLSLMVIKDEPNLKKFQTNNSSETEIGFLF